MPSSFTTNKLLEKPAFNSYVDDWNTPLNADMDDIDAAFGGTTLLNATGQSGVVTLAISEYRPPIIAISGLLTGSVNYQLPSGKGGVWTVYNNTTGAFSITFSSAGGGTSVVIAQTASVIVACDGTNVAVANTYAAGPTTAVQYNSGGTLTGTSNFVHDGTNVGIGTSTPGSRLDVKGTLRLSGSSSGWVGLTGAAAAGGTTYTLPAADGAAGQFLSTNGSATLSWSGITVGVTSWSGGTTGLTPNTPTSGAVVLAGTLVVANGGTGATTAADARTNLNVPTRTGGDASGTWSINVTGNAGSSTTSANCTGNAATATNPQSGGSFITSSNIGGQSVNYAGTAGIANSLGGSTAYTVGSLYSNGNVTAYSDDRLKNRLGYIDGAVAKVMSLKGFYYEPNDTAKAMGVVDKRQVGLSAQDVLAVLPDAICIDRYDYLMVDYSRIVPLLVEAIKEQQILIEALSKKVYG
jgi:hypothetical protein